jgi:hypothetical protein
MEKVPGSVSMQFAAKQRFLTHSLSSSDSANARHVIFFTPSSNAPFTR